MRALGLWKTEKHFWALTSRSDSQLALHWISGWRCWGLRLQGRLVSCSSHSELLAFWGPDICSAYISIFIFDILSLQSPSEKTEGKVCLPPTPEITSLNSHLNCSCYEFFYGKFSALLWVSPCPRISSIALRTYSKFSQPLCNMHTYLIPLTTNYYPYWLNQE